MRSFDPILAFCMVVGLGLACFAAFTLAPAKETVKAKCTHACTCDCKETGDCDCKKFTNGK